MVLEEERSERKPIGILAQTVAYKSILMERLSYILSIYKKYLSYNIRRDEGVVVY